MVILFCENCGSALREEDKFCPNCGEKVQEGGRELTIVLPQGVTKLNVRYEENDTKCVKDSTFEFDPEKVVIPEQCYLEGLAYVVRTGRASISMLQRCLQVGYPKAGNILAWMEENHFISPFVGSSGRQVLLTEEQLLKIISKNKGG